MPLDIGIGILSALFLEHAFVMPFNPFFLGMGILFSLSPDLDFIIVFKKALGAEGYQHRDVLHYPLLFIPIGAIIVSFFNSTLGLLFIITTLLHFIHDSIGIGWGVQWIYPFSRRHYVFFYQRDIHSRKIIYSWTPTEVKQLAGLYGDPNWIKNIYFKVNPYVVTEFLVLLISLIILIFWR